MEKLIKQFKKYWFFFGLLLLALTIVGIDSWTKYVTEKQEDGITKAVEMFFTSDVLKEESTNPQDYEVVELGDGNPVFDFELRNYPDDLRYTESAIKYKLTADSEGVNFDRTANEWTIPAPDDSQNQQSQQIQVKLSDGFWNGVTTSDGIQEKVLTITVTTTEPYEGRQLSAKFLIRRAAESYRVSITDDAGSPYTKVTIDSDKTQEFTLTWNDELVVPDQTNPIFETDIFFDDTTFDGNGKKIRLKSITDGGSVTFLMLKYDDAVYTTNTYTSAFVISPSP